MLSLGNFWDVWHYFKQSFYHTKLWYFCQFPHILTYVCEVTNSVYLSLKVQCCTKKFQLIMESSTHSSMYRFTKSSVSKLEVKWYTQKIHLIIYSCNLANIFNFCWILIFEVYKRMLSPWDVQWWGGHLPLSPIRGEKSHNRR